MIVLPKWETAAAGDNTDHKPTSTKGLSFASCSKMLRGTVSRRACRLVAFSADMRGGCGSWMQRTRFHTAAQQCTEAPGRLLGSDLQQLAGRLSEVADDALQGLALRLVGDGVQVDGACRGRQKRSCWRAETRQLHWEEEKKGLSFLTLISAIVEDVESVDGLFASLLEAKDQIDPLVEVTGHMFTLLEVKTATRGHFKTLIFELSLTFIQSHRQKIKHTFTLLTVI